MKRINVKLVIILVATTFGFGILTVLLHEYQSNRRADALLVRVEQLKGERRYTDAVKLLRNYIGRRPKDYAQHSNLALTMMQALDHQKNESEIPPDPETIRDTMLTIGSALRRNPEDRELLEAAIEIDMRYARFQDAILNLETFIALDPNDDDAAFRVKLALCYWQTGQETQAIDLLKQLIGYDEATRAVRPDLAVAPNELDAYATLAIFYNRRQRTADADAVAEQMTKANPDSARAWMSRSAFAQTMRNDIRSATTYLDRAVELAPEDENALLASGQLALHDQQYERARTLFERLLAVNPKNAGAYQGLATLSVARRDFKTAIDHLENGLKDAPDNLNLLWQLANTEIEMGRIDRAEQTLERVRSGRAAPFYIEFLQGRIHLARREWLQASNKLAGVRHFIEQFRPDWITSLDSNLAACYEQLGKHDQRLEVLNRILLAEPNNIPIRLSKAQALAALRRMDQAIAEYNQLRELIPDLSILSPTMIGAFYELEILKQMSLEESRRDWQPAESMVRLIAQNPGIPRAVAGKVMERYLRASGQHERADDVANRLLAQNPDSLALKLDKLYRDALKKDGFEPALQELTKYRGLYGDLVELRLLEANILATNRAANAKQRFAELEQNTDEYNDAQKVELYFQLGRYCLSMQEFAEARRLWEMAADLRPDDLEQAIRLFELEVISRRSELSNESLRRIEAIVTKDGAEYKWATAALLTLQVQEGKRPKSSLTRATSLVSEAINQRSNWEAPYRLQGEIFYANGQVDSSIESFEKAIELGSDNAETFKRLVRLYHEKGQFRKAKDIQDRLPKSQWDAMDHKIHLDILARLGELPENIDYDRDSKEPNDHVQIGSILASAGRFEEAEEALRRAIDLAPNVPDPWGLMFEIYVRQDRKDDANKILEDAQQQIPADKLPLFLARSYQLLGNWELAEKHFEQASQTKPDDQRIKADLANVYFTSGQTEKSIRLLEEIASSEEPHLESPQDVVAWSRRRLADIVSRSGTYEDFLRAVDLIHANAPKGAILGSNDMLAFAQLCVRRPDPLTLRRTVTALTQASDQRGLVDEEKLALAELLNRLDRWSQAESVMLDLLAKHPNDPKFVNPWLKWSIDRKNYRQAEPWISKVPAESMVAIRAQAHILASQKKGKDALRAVAALMPKDAKPQQAAEVAAIAEILEELGEFEPEAYTYAEIVWKKAASLEPNRLIQLAAYYNRRESKDEVLRGLAATQKLFEVGGEAKTAALQLAVQIVRTHFRILEGDPAVEDSIRSLFDTAIAENPDDGTVLVLRSEFEELMRQSEVAESYLRKFLEKPQSNPRDRAVVLNNLAYRLALRGEKEDSLRFVEEAERLLGPRPDLRDTKGMVLLARGQYDDAIKEFQASIDEGGPAAIKYLHLALAYWRKGDKKAAVEAIREAQKMGIEDDTSMTGVDRQHYSDLIREMKREGLLDEPAE